MKTTIIISLLSLAAFSGFAQSTGTASDGRACKRAPNMPANAKVVFPESAYTPVQQDPSCAPCYEYTTKRGLKVMECPFAWFPAEHRNANGTLTEQPTNAQATTISTTSSLDVQSQNTYTGNYQKSCSRDPQMPANGRPVFPKSAYTPSSNPACAPCYEYTTKRGLKVMECHNLWFPPENK